MLFQVAANQFLVVKKTWPNMFILLFGAIINVILNLTLIPVIGIEGASIATLIGYAVSDIICMIVLCKMKLMVVSFRFVICSLLMVCFFCIWRLLVPSSLLYGIIAAVILVIFYLILYKSEIKSVLFKVKHKLNQKGVDV